MKIYAVDPGTTQSALVVYEGGRVFDHRFMLNDDLLHLLRGRPPGVLVVEQIESMGMAVGAEVFETVWWAGRFHEAWATSRYRLPRRTVKLHLCGQARAKDANIRVALLDKFGPGKEKAIGSKANPGPLYGLRQHEFAALAIAVTWAETQPATV